MERERLLEIFKEDMPERYQEMLKQYYERMAKGAGR